MNILFVLVVKRNRSRFLASVLKETAVYLAGYPAFYDIWSDTGYKRLDYPLSQKAVVSLSSIMNWISCVPWPLKLFLLRCYSSIYSHLFCIVIIQEERLATASNTDSMIIINRWLLYFLMGQCHEIFELYFLLKRFYLGSTWTGVLVSRTFSFSWIFSITKFENRVSA